MRVLELRKLHFTGLTPLRPNKDPQKAINFVFTVLSCRLVPNSGFIRDFKGQKFITRNVYGLFGCQIPQPCFPVYVCPIRVALAHKFYFYDYSGFDRWQLWIVFCRLLALRYKFEFRFSFFVRWAHLLEVSVSKAYCDESIPSFILKSNQISILVFVRSLCFSTFDYKRILDPASGVLWPERSYESHVVILAHFVLNQILWVASFAAIIELLGACRGYDFAESLIFHYASRFVRRGHTLHTFWPNASTFFCNGTLGFALGLNLSWIRSLTCAIVWCGADLSTINLTLRGASFSRRHHTGSVRCCLTCTQTRLKASSVICGDAITRNCKITRSIFSCLAWSFACFEARSIICWNTSTSAC